MSSTDSTTLEDSRTQVNDERRGVLTASLTQSPLSPDPFLQPSSVLGIYNTDDPPLLDCRDAMATTNIVLDVIPLHIGVDKTRRITLSMT